MIEKPFTIDYDVFDVWKGFTSATLYVPLGTKSKYQATDGWKKLNKEHLYEGF